MKVTLRLFDGRKMTFSEVENISILNECSESKATETTKIPTEGKWFKVDPLTIDQNLFKKKRSDSRQEEKRQLILEAFEEMKKNSKYAKPFKTMMPEKTWKRKNVGRLKAMAEKLGDRNANWVEQALEWAQRIANGESWKSICNDRDTANWYRLVVWKSGYCRLVGGSRKFKFNDDVPASDVLDFDYDDDYLCDNTVPLVVLYE